MPSKWSALNNYLFIPSYSLPSVLDNPRKGNGKFRFHCSHPEAVVHTCKKSKHGGKWGRHCLSGVISWLPKYPLWNNGHLTLTSVVMPSSCAKRCSHYHPTVRLLSLKAFHLMSASLLFSLVLNFPISSYPSLRNCFSGCFLLKLHANLPPLPD